MLRCFEGIVGYDNDGIIGSGSLSVTSTGTAINDSNGLPIHGSNAYLSPTNVASITDIDLNELKLFRNTINNFVQQPTSITAAENGSGSFTISITSSATTINYQWQYASSTTPSTW